MNLESPEVRSWFDERYKWLQENPIPVEILRSGHYEDPGYILAVTSITTYFSSPLPITVLDSKFCDSDRVKLEEFAKKYGIRTKGRVGWLLFGSRDC